jgi:hypothetical protein
MVHKKKYVERQLEEEEEEKKRSRREFRVYKRI